MGLEIEKKKSIVPKGFLDNKFLWRVLGIIGTIIAGVVIYNLTHGRG